MAQISLIDHLVDNPLKVIEGTAETTDSTNYFSGKALKIFPYSIVEIKVPSNNFAIYGYRYTTQAYCYASLSGKPRERVNLINEEGSAAYQNLLLQYVNLTKDENVLRIQTDNYNVYLDALDMEYVLPGGIDEVFSIEDLDVGKSIRCSYVSDESDKVGLFYGLGDPDHNLIDRNYVTATPSGSFYFTMVEEKSGSKVLVADRNVQHSISYDTLAQDGIATVRGIDKYFNDISWDRANKSDHVTLSRQDLAVDTGPYPGHMTRATTPVTQGKKYFEVVIGGGNVGEVGFASKSVPLNLDSRAFSAKRGLILHSGNLTANNTTGTPWVAETINTGDVLGVLLDHSAGTLSFYKNGILLGEAFNDLRTLDSLYPYVLGGSTGNDTLKIEYTNYGQEPFIYQPPEGVEGFTSVIAKDFKVRLLKGDPDNRFSEWQTLIRRNGNKVYNNNSWNYTYRGSHTLSRTGATYYFVTTGGGASTASTSSTDNRYTGFRPVLEITSVAVFEGRIDKTSVHREDVKLYGTIRGGSRYEVITNGKVTNSGPITSAIFNLDVTVINRDINIVGSNVIQLDLIDESGFRTPYYFRVVKVNKDPIISSVSVTPSNVIKEDVLVKAVISNLEGGYGTDPNWNGEGFLLRKPINKDKWNQ